MSDPAVAHLHGPLVRAPHPWVDPFLAELYDAFPFSADLGLYTRLAQEQGGNVLELACGTGRVLLPLARAGNRVTGVDASRHMLARASAKLAAADRSASDLVRLVHGDFLSFEAGEGFDLAIVAVKSFAYLTRREEQQHALERIAHHLRPGGMLALDLLNPSPQWVGERPGTLRQDLMEELPSGGVVTRTECTVSTDVAAQVRVIRSIYDVTDHDGTVTKRVVEWPFRFTYRFEAELLLERAGFEIESVDGGYAGEPLTGESTTMMFLARRL